MLPYWTILSALLVVPIQVGPLSHFWLLPLGGPDLVLVTAWAWTWLISRRAGLFFALAAGLLLDFISFAPFGYWLITLVVIVTIMGVLKSRFFTTASLVQSLLTLAIGAVMLQLSESILTGEIVWIKVLISLLCDVAIGLAIFYFLAVRLKLFARWAGQRI